MWGGGRVKGGAKEAGGRGDEEDEFGGLGDNPEVRQLGASWSPPTAHLDPGGSLTSSHPHWQTRILNMLMAHGANSLIAINGPVLGSPTVNDEQCFKLLRHILRESGEMGGGGSSPFFHS